MMMSWNQNIRESLTSLPAAVEEHMARYQVHLALGEIWKRITLCDQFVEQTQPWKMAKDDTQTARLESVLYHLVEALTHVAFHIAPVMPETSQRMQNQLGYSFAEGFKQADLHWGLIEEGHVVSDRSPLFPRLESVEA